MVFTKFSGSKNSIVKYCCVRCCSFRGYGHLPYGCVHKPYGVSFYRSFQWVFISICVLVFMSLYTVSQPERHDCSHAERYGLFLQISRIKKINSLSTYLRVRPYSGTTYSASTAVLSSTRVQLQLRQRAPHSLSVCSSASHGWTTRSALTRSAFCQV